MGSWQSQLFMPVFVENLVGTLLGMMPYESHTIYGKSHTIARRFLRQVRCLFSDIFYPLAQLGYFLIVVLYLIVQLFNIGTVGVNVSIEIENFFFCTCLLYTS